MDYPFLKPPCRIDSIKRTYSIPLCLSSRYAERFEEIFPDVPEHSMVMERARRYPDRYIRLKEKSLFWQQFLQPFLDQEFDKKLVALGKTREQWEAARASERAAARAWLDAQWDNEESREALFAEATRLAEQDRQREAEKKARWEREIRGQILREYGLLGAWKLKIRGFKYDLHDTFKHIWVRKFDHNIYKPRYLSSKNWMRFWLFLQENVIYPLRWKYSVEYQLLMLQQTSRLLEIHLMAVGGISPFPSIQVEQQKKAEALKAIWEEIKQKMKAAESRHQIRVVSRYEKCVEAFSMALVPFYQWEFAWEEAQALKAQEEQAKQLVEVAKVLGAPSTNNALGGVQ